VARITKPDSDFVLKLVALGIMGNGILILAGTLRVQLINRLAHVDTLFINLPLLIGISLIYLGSLLSRRKRAAWFVVLPVYAILLGINVAELGEQLMRNTVEPLALIRNFLVPLIVVVGLWLYRHEFTVKSDIRNLTLSLRFTALILSVVLIYGVVGFHQLDKRDFHEEITWPSSLHHTVDQFDFTTDKELVPYTRRGHLFIDSLNIMSSVAVLYSLVSFFQPLKARFSDQSANRERVRELLERYPSTSEDFFKLWPEDKYYFFGPDRNAGVAYHVARGVALVVGDPFGNPKQFPQVLEFFLEYCRINDWLPAFIHTEPKYNELYKKVDFNIQKIGEEAIVDLNKLGEVANNKYFRHIRNKFEKQHHTTELLKPPHNPAVIARLRDITNDWLKQPGRVERSLMMGYFSEAYMQQSNIMVLRDAASTIQAFISQVPVINKDELTYDLLRHTSASLGNSNDYLLLKFAEYARGENAKRLNLGLCPLAGLHHEDEEETLINSTLKFVYSNGDRFYSFSGLQKFKAKYEPSWEGRYIVYKGGIRNFTRTLNALNKAMKAPRHKK
jgi:phosphatidylglycerol lysyltransferase